MITLSSSTQLTNIIMANYQYQNLYSSWCLLTVFILLIQYPVLAIAQQTRHESTSTAILRSTTTTTISTVLYNDDNVYDGENENSEGDIYDDQEGNSGNSLPTMISQPKLPNNITTHSNKETQLSEYDDETSSYHDDEDELENEIYGNTISVHRPDSRHPIIDSNNKKPFVSQSPYRIPFFSTNLWNDLYAKPAILVGVVGGIIVGMLSAILLIMFIIYRMRKKDEGSYALEDGPRKSPSHAYTRVSSREFFA